MAAHPWAAIRVFCIDEDEAARRMRSPTDTLPEIITSRRTWVGGVLVGIVLTAIATTAGFAFEHRLKQPDVAMMQLLAIIVVAVRFPVGPTIAATLISILSFDYFFIPPRYAFAWVDSKSSVIFVVMLVTAGAISYLNQKLRRGQRRAEIRERTTASLNALLNHLGAAHTVQQVEVIASRDLSELFGASVSVFVAPFLEHRGISETEKSDAEECWRTLEPVRRGARSAPGSLWVPLLSARRPIGVLGMRFADAQEKIQPFERATAERCAQIVATALERTELAAAAEAAEMRVEVEQLNDSLLDAVSHVATPLASIVTASTMLAESTSHEWNDDRRGLAAMVVEAAEQLMRRTENFLALARLRTGQAFIKRETIAVDELVGVAVRRVRAPLKQRAIQVGVPEECPMVSVDRRTIEQVLVDLLENASDQAAGDDAIALSIAHDAESVTIEIANPRTRVISDEEGRGLTLARMLVELHGSTIWVEHRDGRSVVGIRLSRAHKGIDD
jgi:two-component system sensor histidine kinase KdpD